MTEPRDARNYIVVKTVKYNHNRDGWKVTEAPMGHTYLTCDEADAIRRLHPEWHIFARVHGHLGGECGSG